MRECSGRAEMNKTVSYSGAFLRVLLITRKRHLGEKRRWAGGAWWAGGAGYELRWAVSEAAPVSLRKVMLRGEFGKYQRKRLPITDREVDSYLGRLRKRCCMGSNFKN